MGHNDITELYEARTEFPLRAKRQCHLSHGTATSVLLQPAVRSPPDSSAAVQIISLELDWMLRVVSGLDVFLHNNM